MKDTQREIFSIIIGYLCRRHYERKTTCLW